MVTIGPVVSEEKLFEIVDRWTDDGRTSEPAYTISSPGVFGSGKLKMMNFNGDIPTYHNILIMQVAFIWADCGRVMALRVDNVQCRFLDISRART